MGKELKRMITVFLPKKRSTVERAFDEYTTWMGKELKLVGKEEIMMLMK